jgi:hypothetical protein
MVFMIVARSNVAKTLQIPQPELEALMFGLTMAGIEGGGKGTPTRVSTTLRQVLTEFSEFFHVT